jgi:Asp/Glu/hydantoin racemase
VLAPDEAAFTEVVTGGFATVLVLASIDTSLDDTLARLQAEATRAGSSVRFVGVVSREARAAADRDDREALAAALVEAARADAARADAVFLAQYSLSPAADALADALGIPVITGPDTAAVRLRNALGPAS